MCGLGGYTGISDQETRARLVRALGEGIDTRGGDASGYVSIEPSATGAHVHYGRMAGKWLRARNRFVDIAATGHLSVLHARYATCGEGSNPAQAHPFAVRRASAEHGGGMRSVLWGAHNGVLSGTEQTARAFGRKHDVDSRELFELLADDKLDVIRNLKGWGTLAWIERAAQDRVYLVKMTSSACLEVARTKCGGLVYASTKTILERALDESGLEYDHSYKLEIGKVYAAHADGILRQTHKPDITVGDYSKTDYYYDQGWGWDSEPAVKVYSGKTGQWSGAIAASRQVNDRLDAAAHGRDDAADSRSYFPDADYPGECPECYGVDTWSYDGEARCEGCNHTWEWPDDFGKRVMQRLERERDRESDPPPVRVRVSDDGHVSYVTNDGKDEESERTEDEETDPGELTEASDGWDGAAWIAYLEADRERRRKNRQVKAIGRLMRRHFGRTSGGSTGGGS